jgi:prepilin-type N-terminal cleavage/methylation domain-containing protein
MRRRSAQRGATLIEIMISMAVVLVGMMAMFGVLRSSIGGSATASRLTQAQVRAQTILESIRQSPNDALACLVAASNVTAWTTCETTCKNDLPAVHSQDACVYSMSAMNLIDANAPNPGAGAGKGLEFDRNGTRYLLDPRSRVVVAGANNSVYDIDVIVAWNDDNSTNTTPTKAGYHAVELRSGVVPVQ